MLIPLGDDIDHRTLPIVGIVLVLICLFGVIEVERVAFSDPSDEGEAVVALYQKWGVAPTDLAQGNLLGLLTYQFVHAGLFHFLGNMLMLWAFVRTLEDALGSLQFLGLYLFWGVVAGLTESILNWGQEIPLVGASGAIAGVIGAYCVGFGALTKIRTLVWFIYPMRVEIPAGMYIFFWFLSQLWGMAGSEQGIAWFAHLGGFGAGFATMRLIGNQTKRQLVETRDGMLVFEEAGHPQETTEEEAAIEVPECCPACGTAFNDEHRIASNLLRCPNLNCKKLHFLTAPIPSPTAVTS